MGVMMAKQNNPQNCYEEITTDYWLPCVDSEGGIHVSNKAEGVVIFDGEWNKQCEIPLNTLKSLADILYKIHDEIINE